MGIIEVDNLYFKYSDNYILKGTSMEIRKGCLTGILGPNGCGKSTLLKNILNYLKYDKGNIILDDKNLKSYNFQSLAKKVALVPQKSNIRSNFLVKDFILLGRMVHLESKWNGYTKKDTHKVNEVIDRLNLQNFVNRSILSLSGGEFQRVLLARALAQDPKILLMDEPTSNLDINYAVEIMNLSKQLAEENDLTVVVVLHDINLASTFCENLILMKNGQVYYSGKTEDIIQTEIIEEIYNFTPKIIKDENGKKFILPLTSKVKVVV